MRDNYAGDIGDFANNGLLRALCGTPEEPVPGMKLGIIWYRHLDEDDYGRLRRYLQQSEYNDRTFRACDDKLYDHIQALACRKEAMGERLLVTDIADLPIFPPRTQHYPDPLPDPPTVQNRRKWFAEAMRRTADSDLIFLNPDTGMKWDGGRRLQYAYFRELEALFNTGKALVIYQHQQRRTGWVAENTRRLAGVTLNTGHLRVCTWGRESARAYFIVARTEQQIERIDERLAVLRDSPWVATGNFSVD
jgi:hypothetical protein